MKAEAIVCKTPFTTMFTLIIQGALIVTAIGLIAKYFLDFRQSIYRIDHIELAIASAILLLIIVPLTSWIGTKLAINNLVTYNENWGGYETGTQWIRTPTSRDGNMKWSYKGDPYQYVWYTTETETIGSGKNARTRTYQLRHEETRYHDIPYCTEEWTLVVNTTLGDYVIADRNLPDHPNNYRYRAYESEGKALDILFGGRYNGLTTDLTPSGVPLPSHHFAKDWVDPIVGFRARFALGDRWAFGLRGDIGGFSLGSKLTWDAVARFDIRANKSVSFNFGYGVVSTDYESGSGASYLLYDVRMDGPFVGVAFHF